MSWFRHGFKRVGSHATLPTRIARYDLRTGKCRQEIGLEEAD